MADSATKKRGRPATKPLPPRIDAPPEAIAKAMFELPRDHEWEYLKKQETAKAAAR